MYDLLPPWRPSDFMHGNMEGGWYICRAPNEANLLRMIELYDESISCCSRVDIIAILKNSREESFATSIDRD